MSFEQGMKNLNLNTIDYDINEIKNYDLNKLNEIKIKIEFNLSDLFDKLTGVCNHPYQNQTIYMIRICI